MRLSALLSCDEKFLRGSGHPLASPSRLFLPMCLSSDLRRFNMGRLDVAPAARHLGDDATGRKFMYKVVTCEGKARIQWKFDASPILLDSKRSEDSSRRQDGFSGMEVFSKFVALVYISNVPDSLRTLLTILTLRRHMVQKVYR